MLLVPEVPDITIYEFDNPPNKHILSSSQLKDLASDLSSEAKGSYLIRRETVSGIFKKRAEFKDLPRFRFHYFLFTCIYLLLKKNL